MSNNRNYQLTYEGGERIIPLQSDSVEHNALLPAYGTNYRYKVNLTGQAEALADPVFAQNAHREIVWASFAHTNPQNVSVPALAASALIASGSQASNLSNAVVPPLAQNQITINPALLDVSKYDYLTIVVNLSALTGTSLAFEYDFVGDDSGPVTIPLWKPTAATAATSYLVTIGAKVGAAPTISGWSVANIAVGLGLHGTFKWTATAVTAASWTAVIYGNY